MEQESSNAIPGNVVAKGCLGTESTLTECNVREKDYIIMVISILNSTVYAYIFNANHLEFIVEYCCQT